MTTKKDIQQRNRIEINGTIVLALAALAVTWCSYQSTLWSGVQNFRLAESNKYARLSQQFTIVTSQREAVNATMMMSFLNAVVEKNEQRVDYYLRRARPEMKTFLTEWLATDPLHNDNAPTHPMLLPSYQKYLHATLMEADSAKINSDKLWKAGEHANSISDKYVLFTVIFSLVMFLGAISTKMSNMKLNTALILLSAGVCLIVTAIMFLFMPIASAK